MRGLRDIHTHLVYGVDDGAQTAEDMYAMLDAAHENKISALYCTSHQTPGVERFPQETYTAHLNEARRYCRSKGYPVELFSGAEVLYTPAIRNHMESHPLPTLGNSNRVLMEFVPQVPYDEVEEAVRLLLDAGYRPILAHIERYKCLHGNRAFRLKERLDVRFQVNCGTVLTGMDGFGARHIRRWFAEELVDYVSSDFHNTTSRPNRMFKAWAKLRPMLSDAYVRRLMADE